MSRRRGKRSNGLEGVERSTVANHASSLGSQLKTLSDKEKHDIEAGVLVALSEIGFEGLPNFLTRFVDNKTIIKKKDRFCFSIELIESCLKYCNKTILLHHQNRESHLDLKIGNVYCGTGGAAPMILDLKKKVYRPSLSKDLLNAARVVDRLSNLSFFFQTLGTN